MTTKPTIVPLLDLEAVSKHFGVSPKTLRRWWQAGRFPEPIRIGRQRFWRVADVNAVIADQAEKANQASEHEPKRNQSNDKKASNPPRNQRSSQHAAR